MSLNEIKRKQLIVSAVHKISEHAHSLETEPYPECHYWQLKTICGKLWYELWGRQEDTTYNGVEPDSSGIWSLALCDFIKGIGKYEDKDEFEDSIVDLRLSVSEILTLINKRNHHVYEIYNGVDRLKEYVNDETDGLKEHCRPLMELASQIYGKCFTIFKENDYEFAKAYMIHEIAGVLYGNCLPACKHLWDDVTKFLVKRHAHHRIISPFSLYDDELMLIKETWKSLNENFSMENRLYQYLKMSGAYHEYDWEEIDALIKKYGWDGGKFTDVMTLNSKMKDENDDKESNKIRKKLDDKIKHLFK